MLHGTSRPTNPENEPNGIHQELGRATSPAAKTPIPLPRASLSFLVKQPGGLGYRLHSKCSKCSAGLAKRRQEQHIDRSQVSPRPGLNPTRLTTTTHKAVQ